MPWLGIEGRESGAHGRSWACHMSEISLQQGYASVSMPYLKDAKSVCPLHVQKGDGDKGMKMEVGMPRALKRSAFRLQFQPLVSLPKSLTCRIREHANNVTTRVIRDICESLHASDDSMLSSLLTDIRCGPRSLHNNMKHVAKSALLHANPDISSENSYSSTAGDSAIRHHVAT